ncbi:MAG: ECF transporter S component [Bacteroidales bacterium]
MNTTAAKLYRLNYTQAKTYLIATAFVVGNVVLPQLTHFIPKGGFIFLPIYFFTLIAAYKYGWKVGLLTAIASPLVNHIVFGMPPMAVLPIILIKSSLLAMAAGVAAHYFNRLSIGILALVVLSYQIIGTLIEWALVGDAMIAIQDFRLGITGMLLQVFGGFALLRYLLRK